MRPSRIERVIEQLELALEEVEASKTEITAPITSPDEIGAQDAPPVPAGSAATDKKKRRQLPAELPPCGLQPK